MKTKNDYDYSGTQGYTRQVLVVEDDMDMQDLISAVLNENGFTPHSSYDGNEVIRVAEKIRPDLILLDIMLPNRDGIDVCRELSRNRATANIPIIMITAKRDLSDKLSSYIAGAKRYVTKPFEVDELLNEIRLTLRQRSISQAHSDEFDIYGN